ncbi:MAG TPA: CHASE3 domain-containing protein [Allosphingosinicella sp.]|nr:CHASE3 domain-containing protein [Allosphingosinicella sp.]
MDQGGGSSRARRRDYGAAALLAGFLLLIAAVAVTIWLSVRQQEAFVWVRHTLEVENQLSRVLSRLQDAETGQRGYLLTRRPEFLQPYEEATANLRGDLDRLTALVADNPERAAAVQRLRGVALNRDARLRLVIDMARREEALGPTHFLEGKALMDEMRRQVAALKAEEDRLLAARTAQADLYATYVMITLLGSALLVVALGLFAFGNSRRRLAEAVAAQAALEETNRKLIEEAASREAAEAQVRQMQKVEAIGQLTGGIAHDFNNMLAVVIGSLDLARQRLEAGETARATRNVGAALEGAQRAAQLTSRLLAFSRQQPLAPQPLDVNRLVAGMSELIARAIGEQVRVETVLAGGLWRAFADPGQLENVILNLCVNARDAMTPRGGGRLTIETANAYLDDDYAAAHAEVAAGQYVLVSLTDTGTGMPAEVAERAFDPFYTTKGPGEGTGLGLSQVYGFVKQSRGHVKIYSEPGTGTTVKVYLPRVSVTAASPPTEEMEPVEAPRGRGETILVVEDEERVRQVSVETLRSLGYRVVEASGAPEALVVLAETPAVDLLFTDVVMPDMNGRQLAEKAREARPGLKVLFTTGYTRNAIVHNGMLDADVAFIAKPFTADQVARKVRRVLDE